MNYRSIVALQNLSWRHDNSRDVVQFVSTSGHGPKVDMIMPWTRRGPVMTAHDTYLFMTGHDLPQECQVQLLFSPAPRDGRSLASPQTRFNEELH